MWNARFCQNMSFLSSGYDTLLQSPLGIGRLAPSPLEWPAGQITRPGNDAIRFGVWRIVTSPAGWKVESGARPEQLGSCGRVGSCCGLQPGGGTLALGAPSVLKSTPAEPVVSLEITVLLMKSTFNESCIETPPPSQPATLFAMMLLVTVTPYHIIGRSGKVPTSVPLTDWMRRPPPLPLSALLPMIRLALITRPGPAPSLSPGGQSRSLMVPHSWPALGPVVIIRSGAAPSIRRPPPWVGIVGFML